MTLYFTTRCGYRRGRAAGDRSGTGERGDGHVTLRGSHETPPVKTMASGYGVVEVAADGSVSGKVPPVASRAPWRIFMRGRPARPASRSSP